MSKNQRVIVSGVIASSLLVGGAMMPPSPADADFIEDATNAFSNAINHGTISAEPRGVRVRDRVQPPADAQAYGVDGTLTQSEMQTMVHLDYGRRKQRYSDIVGSVGRPYYTTHDRDYYKVPNGSWAEVSYDSEGYAASITFGSNTEGDHRMNAVSPQPAPQPIARPQRQTPPAGNIGQQQYQRVLVPELLPSPNPESPPLPPSPQQEQISYQGQQYINYGNDRSLPQKSEPGCYWKHIPGYRRSQYVCEVMQ